MIILPTLGACFVAIPKTGSLSIARALEAAFPERPLYEAEKLHHWHANLEEVEAANELPCSVFNLWSFAVVRNPFDRLVSYCAAFDTEFSDNPRASIHRALHDAEQEQPCRWLLPQAHFTAGVRTLYRYEAIDDAFSEIKQRLGILPDVVLPKENKSQRDRYVVYFDNESKAKTEQVYARDLEAFNYRF